MDEFTPGQSMQMHFAWEEYRHRVDYSETLSVAADGVSCSFGPVPTQAPQPPTPPPTPPPTLPDQPTIQAGWQTGWDTPRCTAVGGACTSGTLHNSRGTMTDASGNPEPNNPNTIDGCADGVEGTYHSYESIDAVEVSAVGGGFLQVGRTAVVKATVYAYSTGTSDTADFYVTDGDSNPNWIYIESVPANGGGNQIIESPPFDLTSTLMTVRVRFRYGGTEGSCSSNSGYDDTDDLVFAVASDGGGGGGGGGPTTSPPSSPPTEQVR